MVTKEILKRVEEIEARALQPPVPQKKKRRTMTRGEILRMEAGPELDRLVAEQIMGWSEGKHFKVGDFGVVKLGEVIDIWSPSSDIAAAWEVVKELYDRELGIEMYGEKKFPWEAEILIPGGRPVSVQAETLPLAICRAALLAVMEVGNAK